MKRKEFHREKIKEILNALERYKGDLFLLCVSLFYLGVHLIDLHLAENEYGYVDNHGDRSNKLRRIDKTLFTVWKSLLSTSNDQRYKSITSKSHLDRLKEDVLEILSIVTIPEEIKIRVKNILTSL